MNTPILTQQCRAIIRAAVDERFGEGTSDMVEAVQAGDVSMTAIGIRFELSKNGVSQRVRKARTYTRRLLVTAGILPPHNPPSPPTDRLPKLATNSRG